MTRAFDYSLAHGAGLKCAQAGRMKDEYGLGGFEKCDHSEDNMRTARPFSALFSTHHERAAHAVCTIAIHGWNVCPDFLSLLSLKESI
jgi:hypothetical protein